MGLDIAVCKAVFFGDRQLNPFWEWFMENETERFYAIDEGNGFAEVSYDQLRKSMKDWIEKAVWIQKKNGYEELLEEFIAKAGEHEDIILWFNW